MLHDDEHDSPRLRSVYRKTLIVSRIRTYAHACARSTVVAARQSCQFRKRGTGRQRRASVKSCARRRSPFCAAHGKHSSGGTPDQLLEVLGSEIYADLNGWHLYLRDMKATSGAGTVAQDVAKAIGKGDSVADALKQIPMSIGGGKKDISLFDLVPTSAVNNAKNGVMDLEQR